MHALVAEKDPEALEVLARVGVSLDRLTSVLPAIPKTAVDTRNREIPFGDELTIALAVARNEREASYQGRLSGAHLILGLLQAGGAASRVLADVGVSVENVRVVASERSTWRVI